MNTNWLILSPLQSIHTHTHTGCSWTQVMPVQPPLPPPPPLPPTQRGTGMRPFTFDLCQETRWRYGGDVAHRKNSVTGNDRSAFVCVRTSPCVPLLQASEKTELTILWERVWPDVAISDTPLSDWLEWLDWDSGLWSHKHAKKKKHCQDFR